MHRNCRAQWVVLPILLIGLLGVSSSTAATAADRAEKVDNIWTSHGLELVTVEPFELERSMNGDSSGRTLPRTYAECALDPTGIISRWPLNEADGATKFVDKISGHHGLCEGDTCPSAADGILQGAFQFTAREEDEIRVPATTDFDWLQEDDFSIGVWVKTNQDCEGNKVFVGRYRFGEGTWWVGCTPNENNPAAGLAVFRMRDNTSVPRQVNGTSAINDGRWHYIVGVRDGKNDNNLLYVDGRLENSSNLRTYAGNFINSQDVTFGGYDEPRDYYLEGSLDEIVIYGRAFTAKEIQKYYYACDPPEIYLPVIVR
jgi:hypothetical protein